MLCLTEASWIGRFQKEPALRDKVGVCRVPGTREVYSVMGRDCAES